MEFNRRSSARESGSPDRRSKPRVAGDFPATVRGVDINGQPFEETSRLDNLSASGLFLELPRHVEPGMSVFVVFPFPTAAAAKAPPPRVAVRGTVRRVVPQPDGKRGVGVSFQHHRLL